MRTRASGWTPTAESSPAEACTPPGPGRPTASTSCPTRLAPVGASSAATSSPSTRSTARSECGSRPASVAARSLPSGRPIAISSSRSSTWSAVTTTELSPVASSRGHTTPLAGSRRRASTSTVAAAARSTASASPSETAHTVSVAPPFFSAIVASPSFERCVSMRNAPSRMRSVAAMADRPIGQVQPVDPGRGGSRG